MKILDFGLAKAMLPALGQRAQLDDSPTLTVVDATQAGMILGTAAYMSPEAGQGQSRGSAGRHLGVRRHRPRAADRQDACSSGDTVVEILGQVLNSDPDITLAPARVHPLLRWCLEKERKDRLAAIGDARRCSPENAGLVPTTAPRLSAFLATAVDMGVCCIRR